MSLCAASLLCAAALAGALPSDEKPNVLLIVADDLGFSDVDFQPNNRSVVRTPNLRELAMGGIRLINHHVQPFCSPTRAALMTGRHVLRYGLQNTVVWPQDAWAVPKNETLLSDRLKQQGYYTAQYGKWHLGLFKQWAVPTSRSFDEQYGYYLGGEDYWTHARNGGLDWHRNGTLETGDNGTYSADLLGDAASGFIRRRSSSGGANPPWFLYLPFQSVHSPLEAPDDCLNRYPGLKGSQKTRAAMVSSLDDQVGKITKTLKETSQLDRTIIIFTSDNGAPDGDALDMEIGSRVLDIPGYFMPPGDGSKPVRPPSGGGSPPHGSGGGSNWPFSGWKHYVFEGGIRSAAFVRYPPLTGDMAGKTHNGLFHAVDWVPTIMSLVGAGDRAGATLPLDGLDIGPALRQGGSVSPHTELPVQITACGDGEPRSIVSGPGAAIIVGDLKLIVDCYWRASKNISGSHVQLYNITADLAEEKDLAAERPQDVTRLVERLDYWEQQSVEPYNKFAIDKSCGQGKPQGQPPHWDSWC